MDTPMDDQKQEACACNSEEGCACNASAAGEAPTPETGDEAAAPAPEAGNDMAQ